MIPHNREQRMPVSEAAELLGMNPQLLIVFQNSNGTDYFIVAGTDKRALLRDMDSGYYVIATNLDWRYRCWGGGEYFASNEFEIAVKAFLEG